MAGERYPHLFLDGTAETREFMTARTGGGRKVEPPSRDRQRHSAFLKGRFEAAWSQAEENRRAVAHVSRQGVYLNFRGEPGFDLPAKSLESRPAGIRLLNAVRVGGENSGCVSATVYVPNEKRQHFLKKLSAYANEDDKRSGEPKNKALVASLADIRLAVLESFWCDAPERMPAGESDWVEVWLSTEDRQVVVEFRQLAEALEVAVKEGVLTFPERSVVLVKANREQLSALVASADSLAELRAAKELATFFIEMDNADQVEWVRDLLRRTTVEADSDVSVCILDTGVNNGHMLLKPVLADEDLHTADPAWGKADHQGHGTLMAGTVAYGDILSLLQDNHSLTIGHRLESAKILPPPPATNPKELWGHMTSRGISRAETGRPGSKRIVCMAVTSADFRDRGEPSSWSATMDELCSGYADDTRRLIIVSAGNVEDPECWKNYPADNLTNEIHDPAQSWNALTVGAMTEKVDLNGSYWSGYKALAERGELSPFSSTSLTWEGRKWPIKPEIVFEGGNVARGANDSIIDADDLQLLSTSHDPTSAQFAPFKATSAAAAQAAHMAANIQVRYPDAWPETIRALIVHSAEWSHAMKNQFLDFVNGKTGRCKLLRVFGYGVPNLARALHCTTNSLTLIVQEQMQPFEEVRDVSNARKRKTRDMHVHLLPWPQEILQELGEMQVTMRVTLSYFIEPGPGQIGWADRYRYPSHGLRFAVNNSSESRTDFEARINKLARDDEGSHPGTSSPSEKWFFGEGRDLGSIHSDIWQGTAAELAASNLIGVYPIVGWWRERHHLGRVEKKCKYSLIVSIHTPAEDIDIYTPVAIKAGVRVPVMVSF